MTMTAGAATSSPRKGADATLDRVLADLGAITGMAVAVFDEDGREIAGVPPVADSGQWNAETVEVPIVVSGLDVGRVRVRAHGGDRDAVIQAESVARLAASFVEGRAQAEREQHAMAAELDAMADELLARYEEITTLSQLGEALGAVFEPKEICRISLQRAQLATGAQSGLVALSETDVLSTEAGAEDAAAVAAARCAVRTRRQVLLHEGESPETGAESEVAAGGPLLAVPLVPMTGGEVDAPLGALVVGRPPGAGRFTAGDAKLATSIAMQVASAIRSSRLIASLREAERVQHEIEIAADVQRALLPGSPPTLAGLELSGRCVPATNVGGDLYDHVLDRSGGLWLLIADVAGHSIGSALIMAMARTVLRREIADGRSPTEVLAATNETLYADLDASGLFITVFCGRLDLATGDFTYASGGQNPPLLRRASGELVELDADGMPAGFLPTIQYEEKKLRLSAGDLVVLYTDGVVEAEGTDGTLFGEDRLRNVVEKSGDAPASSVVGAIFEGLDQHGGHQADDVTLLAARWGDPI